jgi:hypothetical protein
MHSRRSRTELHACVYRHTNVKVERVGEMRRVLTSLVNVTIFSPGICHPAWKNLDMPSLCRPWSISHPAS